MALKYQISWYSLLIESRSSVVGMATGYGLDNRKVGVRVPVESGILTSTCRPYRLWSSPNLVSNDYQEPFSPR
jgi:hypothetical protein